MPRRPRIPIKLLMRVPNEDGRDRNVPEIDHRSEQYDIKIDREETNDGDTEIGFQCVLRRYPHSLPIVHAIVRHVPAYVRFHGPSENTSILSDQEIMIHYRFELIDKGCQDKLISVEWSRSEYMRVSATREANPR